MGLLNCFCCNDHQALGRLPFEGGRFCALLRGGNQEKWLGRFPCPLPAYSLFCAVAPLKFDVIFLQPDPRLSFRKRWKTTPWTGTE